MSLSSQPHTTLARPALLTGNRTRSHFAPLIASSPINYSDSGVIILSSTTRILHMNSKARVLMGLFGEAHELWPSLAPESMPSIVVEFCGDILSELRRRTETEDWVQVEMRRICHMVTPSLLLRGFGMPTTSGQEPLMILTLQSCNVLPLAHSRK